VHHPDSQNRKNCVFLSYPLEDFGGNVSALSLGRWKDPISDNLTSSLSLCLSYNQNNVEVVVFEVRGLLYSEMFG